jgi:hypothetical protein
VNPRKYRNNYSVYKSLSNKKTFSTEIARTIQSGVDRILCIYQEKIENLTSTTMVDSVAASESISTLWRNKTDALLNYFEKTILAGKISRDKICEIATATKELINSQNYLITGKYSRFETLGFAIVKSSKELNELNNRLEQFIQKNRPISQNSSNLWLANLLNITLDAVNSFKNNKFSTLVVLLSYYSVNTQAQPIPTEGLVAFYPFNGNAFDESGNGNHGKVVGAESVPDRFNQSNSAFRFNGIDSYIWGPAGLFPATERTISIWYKPDIYDYAPNLDRGGYIFGYGGDGCGTSSIMIINNICNPLNNHDFQSHCRVNEVLYANDDMYGSPSNWVHWAVTTSDIGTKMYINAKLVLDNPYVFMNNTFVHRTEFSIGSGIKIDGTSPYSDFCAPYFRGLIDDVKIYNMSLSYSSIQALFNASNEAKPISPPLAPTISTAKNNRTYIERMNNLTFWISFATTASTLAIIGLYGRCRKKPKSTTSVKSASETDSIYLKYTKSTAYNSI